MKNLNKLLISIFTLFFCYSNAQMDWVDFGNNGESEQAPNMTMVNDSTIRIEFFGMNRYNKVENDTLYDVLKFSGMNGKTIDLGLPELPLKACYFEVKVDNPSVEIISEDFILLDDFYIMPAQEYKEPIEGDTIFQFIKNDSLYKTDIFYPAYNSRITNPQNLREHKISSIIFYPVKFNPVTKQLKVYQHIEVIIHGAGSIESDKDNSYFDSFLDGLILNYEKNKTPDEIIDLMIITPDEYYSSLLPFKECKETIGVRTKIITRDSIEEAGYTWMADPVGEDWEYMGIDNYIKNYYETETGLTPEFLLFVGETDTLTPEMPTHYWKYFNGYGWIPSPATDLYYTTMHIIPNSDTLGLYDLPDMFSGRISVDSTAELDIILKKIIDYEKSPYLDQTDWFNNVNLSAYYEPWIDFEPDTSDCDVAEFAYFLYTSYSVGEYLSQMNYNLEKIFVNTHLGNYPDDIQCWEWQEHLPPDIPFYLDDTDATNAVIQSINNGCFLVNHRDHGNSRNFNLNADDGWLHPEFNQNHINSLTNDDMLPVMFSINCKTGWFDGGSDVIPYQQVNYDCLGELLLSKENGGVVGFIGSTRKSRSGYNDELCYGFFDAIWDDFDLFNNGIQTPIYKLGAIKDYGLYYMINKFYFGNSTTQYHPDFIKSLEYNRKQFEEFHVLGDPTLEIWTGIPQPLYAWVDFDQNKVTVYDENDQVIPAAKVVLQHGDSYEVRMTNGNGQIYSTLLNNYNVEVSALKHNYIPWYSTIISGNTTWAAGEDVRGNIIIEEGGTLTFENDVTVPKYARIIVMEGATLNIDNNISMDFENEYNDILAFGNLDFEANVNVSMISDGQSTAQINLLNEDLTYSFTGLHLKKCNLYGNPNSLYLNISTFENCKVEIEEANINIMSSDFTSAYVDVSNPKTESSYVYITEGCSFTNTDDAITIEGYWKYNISNNVISNCTNGILLFNSGRSLTERSIRSNQINNHSGTGITIYNSYADIMHNAVYNNGYGIECLDRSDVHIEGDSHVLTQEIRDNEFNEVYATEGSFPHYFHWNLVQDEDNLPGDPMVLYKGPELELDVTYNCWGNNFDPEKDFSPPASFKYIPEWDCQSSSGGAGSAAENLYKQARVDIENEDYESAQTGFREIIIDYPETKYAQASLKELYALEGFVNNDYSGLKDYYTTEQAISNNTELNELAEFLITFCEIKLENWPTAIAWFENIIQNPTSIEDSIFAIIDLGYTYFLMENSGLKSAYSGSLVQHIPASVEQFTEKRDYLLSLIPEPPKEGLLYESLSSLKPGTLMQNIPNPFSRLTDIYYKLDRGSTIEICIYDNSGRIIKSIEDSGTKGVNKVTFNATGYPAGVYYYNLLIDGSVSDSKKMTIMK